MTEKTQITTFVYDSNQKLIWVHATEAEIDSITYSPGGGRTHHMSAPRGDRRKLNKPDKPKRSKGKPRNS
ncbi:MAG: hypothetical protein ACREJQ_00825 [bacterium]